MVKQQKVAAMPHSQKEPEKSGSSSKSKVRVPNEIPISCGQARSAIRNNHCMVCVASGVEKNATSRELNACDNPIHVAYMRRITRWAKRLAIAAV